MRDSTTRRRLIQGTASAGVVLLAGCLGLGSNSEGLDGDGSMDDGSMSGPRTVRVRVENVSDPSFYGSEAATGGQIWITPGAYAVHMSDTPVFAEGESASVGLEAAAEAGRPGASRARTVSSTNSTR